MQETFIDLIIHTLNTLNNKPARSTTVCDLVVDAKIEIEAIAYKPLKD